MVDGPLEDEGHGLPGKRATQHTEVPCIDQRLMLVHTLRSS